MRMSIKSQGVAFSYGFAIIIIWYFSGFDWTPRYDKRIDSVRVTNEINDSFTETTLRPNIKYILQWTKPYKEPFTFMKPGQDVFLERRCPVNNCYVTWNRTYLSNVTDYHAILFYCHDVSRGFIRIPRRRSAHQKYVFVSPEPAGYYPVYHERFNGFFNMTWTYKLDSEVFYGYILIRDKDGKKIGPKEVMHWPKVTEMQRINHKLKEKLNQKRIAAAWLVSNCHTRSGREVVALEIKQKLMKYNMTVDIFGSCGQTLPEMFWQMLETKYYFYFSFENSISEDYVTEKLLNALQHYMVPIVYGGANYTRFMPDGIYLNAVVSSSVEEVVKQIVDIVNDKERYYDFFRWHNHYTYHYAGDTPETDYYCEFCKKINDDNFMTQITAKKDFARWWND